MTVAEHSIALIDIAEWRTKADPGTARRIVDAFQDLGFAYITGHGVDPALIDGIFTASRGFFSQDATRMARLHHRNAGNFRGHVPIGQTPGPGGRYETFDIGLELPPGYTGPGHALRETPNLWPEPLEFRATIRRYQNAMRELADSVLSAVATGLGLAGDFFLTRCGQPHAQLRLLHYPPQRDAAEGDLSVGRHSDYEALTILAQDAVGGLQVRTPDGGWINVRPRPDAFVLNVGEMLTRWTNDLLPATPHRVLSPRDRHRYSVAFFYASSYDTLIEPVPQPGDTRHYEAITVGEYLSRRLGEVGN
jgi:isopenicillin N synthase-like dioxygenase